MPASDIDTRVLRGGGYSRRLVVYAIDDARTGVDTAIREALRAFRGQAQRLVVVSAGNLSRSDRRELSLLSDDLQHHDGRPFGRWMYRAAVEASRLLLPIDEVVLTGNTWFGPRAPGLGGVLDAATASGAEVWELVEQVEHTQRDFGPQGFPLRERPYLWTVVRGRALASGLWSSSDTRALTPRARQAGLTTGAMFSAAETGSADAELLAADRLLRAGCPILPRRPFVQFPPFLEQHGVIGREILATARQCGFATSPVLASLARTIPPKALNANLAMLEIMPEFPASEPAALRLLVVAHVTDLTAAESLLPRLACLPAGYDLVMATTDGAKAARLQRMLRERHDERAGHAEVRVTPSNRGRGMSDVFIAARDRVFGGGYDLVLVLQCRPMASKTRVLRTYFRRYQYDNLLASSAHVSRILDLFRSEPGLGLVFPPMIHIGYQTAGRAWGIYRDAAVRLSRRLGITVPLDEVSPLAPFGGMFYARPDALRTMADIEWTYRDYGAAGQPAYRDLARLQERMLTAAAAQRGYHSRTVLTAEHAQISHTALEYKADDIAATTRGYPVDRIVLMQRAGHTGRGGAVGLTRMYLRLNHPRLAAVTLPMLRVAEHLFLAVQSVATRWDAARSRSLSRKGADR